MTRPLSRGKPGCDREIPAFASVADGDEVLSREIVASDAVARVPLFVDVAECSAVFAAFPIFFLQMEALEMFHQR